MILSFFTALLCVLALSLNPSSALGARILEGTLRPVLPHSLREAGANAFLPGETNPLLHTEMDNLHCMSSGGLILYYWRK